MDEPVTLAVADDLTRRVIADVCAAYGFAVLWAGPGDDADIVLTESPVRLGRVLHQVRRIASGAARTLKPVALGRYIFDPVTSTLQGSDDQATEIILTEKEAEILCCLARAGGGFVSRRELLTDVWGYVEGVETHTIETHIYRLRQKIETDPASPLLLLTDEQGYRLALPGSD